MQLVLKADIWPGIDNKLNIKHILTDGIRFRDYEIYYDTGIIIVVGMSGY